MLSVYVAIDPGDRSAAWRVELADRLRDALGSDGEGRAGKALRATAERAQGPFTGHGPPPEGRGQIGFLEIDEDGGRELWYSAQIAPRRTEAVRGHRPYLRPLVEILERGARMGVAAVSGDQLRVWEWELGALAEHDDLTLSPAGETRERRAQRPSDPARFQGASSSGKEQFEHRIEAHRDRFLKQAARKAESDAAERGWVELLVFGETEHVSRFTDALGGREPHHVEAKNVVAEPTAQIADRVERMVPDLLRQRELRLIETIKNSAYTGKERASLGPQETLEALSAGRVDHLVFDAERDYNGHGIEQGLAYEGPPLGESGLPVAELLIERALETGARITPVIGDAASALDEHDGVAALLRY